MPFCPECKSLVYPDPKTKMLVCKKCGTKIESTGPRLVSANVEKKTEMLVIDETSRQIETRGTTKTECPKCHHDTAYAEFRQTRKSDEPPTMFCECVNCGHRWRQY